MDSGKFWLVWCESKGQPTHKHASIDGAQREAERLARANPGCEFNVLEWCGACVRPQYVFWRGEEPIQF